MKVLCKCWCFAGVVLCGYHAVYWVWGLSAPVSSLSPTHRCLLPGHLPDAPNQGLQRLLLAGIIIPDKCSNFISTIYAHIFIVIYVVYESAVVSQVLQVWKKPNSKLHVQHVGKDQLSPDQMSMWVCEHYIVLVVFAALCNLIFYLFKV